MEQELHKIEDSEYISPRRMAGIARLAIHTAFETSMSQADRGQMTRENALAHIAAIRTRILKSHGVFEGFDDAQV